VSKWLTAIGLACNMAGVAMIFFFGVPRYRSVADAGKSYLQVEADDSESEQRAKRASRLSRLGLTLLAVGFALQLVALWR